ncbi:hypothetical protein O3M35_002358 [Rhynocoris fuscipes]|uniref:Uncharacterized protein n=1 Tax=Rhynocoris fuscipes TaxID=488301 RepID=A0AAW1CSR3_9HEMI
MSALPMMTYVDFGSKRKKPQSTSCASVRGWRGCDLESWRNLITSPCSFMEEPLSKLKTFINESGLRAFL